MKYSKFSKERMLSQLPYYERLNNKMIQEIYRVLGDEADELFYKIEDLYKQLFLDTATWGLDAWEKSLDIQTPKGLSYEERRAIIKTKLKMFGKVSTQTLESAIQDYYNRQKVDVYFNGRLFFRIPLEGGNPDLYEKILEIINDMKPAHLGYDIEFYMQPIPHNVWIGAYTLGGESVTVYPRSPQNIAINPKTYVSAGYSSIGETVIINSTKKEKEIDLELKLNYANNIINQLEKIELHSERKGER